MKLKERWSKNNVFKNTHLSRLGDIKQMCWVDFNFLYTVYGWMCSILQMFYFIFYLWEKLYFKSLFNVPVLPHPPKNVSVLWGLINPSKTLWQSLQSARLTLQYTVQYMWTHKALLKFIISRIKGNFSELLVITKPLWSIYYFCAVIS